MSALRDLALTVLELEANEYHWVLMEAVQADSDECLVYRPVDSSTRGLPDYSEALIQGASALRVLQGLAPFGKPVSPVSLGEQPASEPSDSAPPKRASASKPTRPAALKPDPNSGSDSGSDSDSDSCMFTTGHASL